MEISRRLFIAAAVGAVVSPSLAATSGATDVSSLVDSHLAFIRDALKYEVTDDITMGQAKTMLDDYLESLKNQRLVYDYRVVCDESNNTSESIQEKKLNIDVYATPRLSL